MKFFVRTLLTALIVFNTSAAHATDLSAKVSADELAKFAPAYKDVETLRAQYIQQAEAINDPQQLSEMQMAMQQKMIETVTKHGLSIDTYNSMTQALASNEELRKELAALF